MGAILFCIMFQIRKNMQKKLFYLNREYAKSWTCLTIVTTNKFGLEGKKHTNAYKS